jgi:ABC-type transport system substrate-binding protein
METLQRSFRYVLAAVLVAYTGCDDEEASGPADTATDVTDAADDAAAEVADSQDEAADAVADADQGDVAEGPYGGTLQLAALFELPDGLDPTIEYYAVSWQLLNRLLLRTLVAYEGVAGPSGNVVHPDLAAQLPTVSEDGLTWTFVLRDDVYYGPPFEDVQVVSGDFVRAFERLAVLGSYSFYYVTIEGFVAYADGEAETISGLVTPDDQTLEIHLTEPTGHLDYLVTMPATAPIPRFEDAPWGVAEGHDEGYGGFQVATGPRQIEE